MIVVLSPRFIGSRTRRRANEPENNENALVKRDIEWIVDGVLSNDLSLLWDVLTGDGWVPYNQLTDEQVLETYTEMMMEEEVNE